MTEAQAIVAFAVVFMALAFTIAAYALRNVGLVLAGAISWVVLLAEAYVTSTYFTTGVMDIWFVIVWLSVAMVIVCGMEPIMMRSHKKDRQLGETISEEYDPDKGKFRTLEDDIDEKDDDEDSGAISRDYRRTRAGTQTIRAVRDGRRRKASKFARTGAMNGR